MAEWGVMETRGGEVILGVGFMPIKFSLQPCTPTEAVPITGKEVQLRERLWLSQGHIAWCERGRVQTLNQDHVCATAALRCLPGAGMLKKPWHSQGAGDRHKGRGDSGGHFGGGGWGLHPGGFHQARGGGLTD